MTRTPSALLAALALAAFAFASAAQAQPTELFFSEYIEGSSNNKALEIYNGTGAPVNLAGYSVQMAFNGNPVPSLTINLSAVTVASGDVYVLAHASAVPAILEQADQTNGSGWFNGDDAVILRRGATIIDVIGQIGFDPGSQWGAGLTSTADNTIRRRLTVEAGDPDGGDPFDPAAEWDGFATDTFGGLGCHTADPVCPQPPPPPAPLAAIWEIQGAGMASPVANQRRRTEGNVVTAVLPDGFFIQATGGGDGDAETSDGIFVFTSAAPAVAVGDLVMAQGRVVEFFEMTEIDADAVEVVASGFTLPAAVVFDPTLPSPNAPQPANELERFEGMLVRVENGAVSSPTNQFHEASIVAAAARAFREPGILFPGLPGLPVWDGNPEIFEIDTDRFAGAPGLEIAGGATVAAEGPLAFSFGDYQIWPTSLAVSAAPAVVPVRAAGPGELTIGSQNMLRLCDTVDDECADRTPTPAEYAARLRKLSLHVRAALRAPDVLAVQEVETLAVLQDLASQINADDPSVGYSAHLLEGNDIGGIDVGFLVRGTVRVDSVAQFGKDDVFVWDGEASLLNDRPPLVLRGAYLGNGAPFPFVVIDVHQRSLSGVEGNSDNARRVRAKRHEQALRLSLYIDALQDAEPGLRLVVIGDFNAFEFTDGYVDVMGQVTGGPDPAGALVPATDEIDLDLTNRTLLMPAGERYSFVFDGTAQSLDHALTSQGLDPWVRGAEHSRGNADAPFAFANVETTPLRASDHDGTVVFVMTDEDADGVPDDRDRCAGTAAPESVPTVRLNPNHYALVDGDGVFDTRGNGPGDTFTLADTAGCGCGQILDAIGAGHGQYKHGCTLGTMRNWVNELP
jgi:predicted extracellular nuclease